MGATVDKSHQNKLQIHRQLQRYARAFVFKTFFVWGFFRFALTFHFSYPLFSYFDFVIYYDFLLLAIFSYILLYPYLSCIHHCCIRLPFALIQKLRLCWCAAVLSAQLQILFVVNFFMLIFLLIFASNTLVFLLDFTLLYSFAFSTHLPLM